MKTARFIGDKKVKIEEKPMPEIKDDEVLIEVKRCGLCGSEREQYLEGYHQQQGHEVTGIISKTGSKVDLQSGTRIAAYLTKFCGSCQFCEQGLTTMCSHYEEKENLGWSWPGGFAEYMALPARNALPLPDDLSFEQGVILLDTLGTPFHGLRYAKAEKLSSACVIGCGTVGLGTIIVLKAMGLEKIFAADLSDYRVDMAAKLGAITINPTKTDPIDFIQENTDTGVDLVVEAVGKPLTLKQGIKMIKPGGKVLCLGEQPEEFSLTIDLKIRLKDHSLLRSWYFPLKEYKENVRLMQDGFFAGHEQLITHVFKLEEMQKAADLFYGGETGKVLIKL
ncbi:MAG: zinc-dependent alcohol dehydrogenase [Halanaerobiales bacterium]